MKRFSLLLLGLIAALTFTNTPVWAQETAPVEQPKLLVMTDYPAQEASAGEKITLKLDLETNLNAQIVDLLLQDLPDGWTAVFRGKNKVVESVFVSPDHAGSVDLRVEIPANTPAGEYTFTVLAKGDTLNARLPITFMVAESGPANLSMDVDLPIIRNKPDSKFRFNATLKNESSEDITVDLSANLPDGFTAVFKSNNQEITSLPITADSTERIVIEVDPLFDDLTPAGQYPIEVIADSGELKAYTELVAEIVGEPRLTFTTPDNRLSGDIEAGKETAVTLVLGNTGSAPARNIDMSATLPNGWKATFEPETIPAIEPGSQVQVTAKIQPSEKALAGDYMLTFRAKPEDTANKSIEYRATVQTSTMWGLVGVAFIAVAVLALGLAVARFGRR
ncbi:MAG: NEW3 domain-containing protein [Candidatus Promineifilaceae bacterium]